MHSLITHQTHSNINYNVDILFRHCVLAYKIANRDIDQNP